MVAVNVMSSGPISDGGIWFSCDRWLGQAKRPTMAASGGQLDGPVDGDQRSLARCDTVPVEQRTRRGSTAGSVHSAHAEQWSRIEAGRSDALTSRGRTAPDGAGRARYRRSMAAPMSARPQGVRIEWSQVAAPVRAAV